MVDDCVGNDQSSPNAGHIAVIDKVIKVSNDFMVDDCVCNDQVIA